MAIDLYDSVEARMTAYITPNTPQTQAQQEAFDTAVEVQVEYETEAAQWQTAPAGAQSYSMSNDGVSVSVTMGSSGAAYTEATLHPYAWALLKNAGLLRRGDVPTARRM